MTKAEASTLLSHKCGVPDCPNTTDPKQNYCNDHRCSWLNEDGERCIERALDGDRCDAHVLLKPIDITPVLEKESDITPFIEPVRIPASPPEELPIEKKITSERKQISRRVRKTWELPGTAVEELSEFTNRLSAQLGIKLSEAHNVSIAIRVYMIFIKNNPQILDLIDTSITGYETVPRTQELVERVILEEARKQSKAT